MASLGLLGLFRSEVFSAELGEIALAAGLLFAGSVAGSVLASWLAARMGARTPWVAGAVGAVIAGWIVFGVHLTLVG